MKAILKGDGRVRWVLSRSEKKFLKALINSDGTESVASLCKKAGVHSGVYYKMIEHPKLKYLLPEAMNYLLAQQILPVIQAVIKRATEGSAKHAEIVLRLCGLLEAEGSRLVQIFTHTEEGRKFLSERDISGLLGGPLKRREEVIDEPENRGTEEEIDEGGPPSGVSRIQEISQ